MACLCLLADDGSTVGRWELGSRPVAFGRGETVDVVIADDTLSREHFQIAREGGGFILKDLSSQNGTFVDGKPAKNTPLHDSDCILAGRSVFVFVDRKANGNSARPRV